MTDSTTPIPPSPMSRGTGPGMAPDDVYSLADIGAPHVSPDGSLVAFQVTAADRQKSSYQSRIWVVPFDGSRPATPFTTGEAVDSAPRWSPCGEFLAFTSSRGGRPPQLYVIPAAGGEARRLTDLPEAVGEIAWAPDSSSICFTSRVPDEASPETDERRREPLRITRLMFKANGVGFTSGRRNHLFVVDVATAECRQVTSGDAEDAAPEWTPDGNGLVFSSLRGDRWDADLLWRLYRVELSGDRLECLTGDEGSCSAPKFSPDGQRLAFQFVPEDGTAPHHTQVAVADWSVPLKQPTLLTTGLDRHCGPYFYGSAVVWAGNDLVHAVDDHGNVHLYSTAADGTSPPKLLVGGELSVSSSHYAAGNLAYVASTCNRTSRLLGAGGTVLYDSSAHHEIEFVSAERFTAVAQDSEHVDSWIVRPAGFTPGTRYPALLLIHGGPFAQFGSAFLDEVQVLAHAGYAVIYANPRGSSGRSEAWGRAIRGPSGDAGPGWGTVDYADLMSVVDTALERFDFLDATRLGVLGGSYGGYMTSWLISHTDRFKAAISERAVNNLLSCFGSSDIFWAFSQWVGCMPWEDPAAWLNPSPASYAHRIDTPLLIIHAEQDLRGAVEQAENLFTILRLLDKEVELLRFPGEHHDLSRTGSPIHRVQRFEAVLEWFARHLDHHPARTEAAAQGASDHGG